MRAAREDIEAFIEEALADCGVRRGMTVAGTTYYANGTAFAAARGDTLYLRLHWPERQRMETEAALSGHTLAQPDYLGLVPIPYTVYRDVDRVSALLLSSCEQTMRAAC